MTTNNDSAKAREFWINSADIALIACKPGEVLRAHAIDSVPSDYQKAWVHVIEYSAYQNLLEENEKLKKALRDTADGRPSEWAYVQLKKDYDRLRAALEFYADRKYMKPKSIFDHGGDYEDSDRGETARRALSGEGEK